MTATGWASAVLFCIVILFFSNVYAGDSGMTYQSSSGMSPEDRPPFETKFCSGPVKEENYFTASCPTSTLLVAPTTRGIINRVETAIAVAYGSSMTCGSAFPTSGTCWCSSKASMETRCVGRDSCTYQITSSNIGCTYCSCCYVYQIADYYCSGFQRNRMWGVWKGTSSDPIFWISALGIYRVAPGQPADSTPTQVISFSDAQTEGVQVWIWSNRMYILLGNVANSGRVYELPNVPSTSTSFPSTYLTPIVPSSGSFASAVQASSNLFTAGVTTGLRSWSKSSGSWINTGSWSIPSCGTDRCFDFSRTVSLLLPPIDGITYAAFGATSGKVVLHNTDDPAFLKAPEVLFAGAGNVLSMAYIQVGNTPYILLGTSLSLIFQYDVGGRRIANLAAFSNPSVSQLPVYALAADSATMSVYAGSGDQLYKGFVARIRITPQMDMFDIEQLPPTNTNYNTGAVRGLVIDVASNSLYAGVDQPISTNPLTSIWNLGSRVYKYTLADCARYTCSQCGYSDASFCGWCAGTATCVLLPSMAAGACPSDKLPFTTPAICPIAKSLNRDSGTTQGGSLIKFIGSNFFAGTNAASLFSCTINGVAGTISGVTATEVGCITPAGAAGIVNARLFVSGNEVTNTASPPQFRYVDCSTLDCNTCFGLGGDCAWCHRQGTCTAATQCTGPKSTTECPSVTGISASISSSGPSSVYYINATQLSADQTYRCVIGDYPAVASVMDSATGVRCNRPDGMPATIDRPYLQIWDGTSWNRFTQDRQSDPSLEVYDCDAIGACFSCTFGKPDCSFCKASADTFGGCSYNASSTSCSKTFSNCPKLVSATPNRLHYSANSGDPVAVVISGTDSVDFTKFRCIWRNSSASIIANQPAITPLLNSATCTVPSVNLTVPYVTLEITIDAMPHTDPISITVYDCSSGTNCLTCEDAQNRPKCKWCNALLICEASSALPGGACPSSGACPTISLSPAEGTTAGGTTVTVTPTPFPPKTTNVVCKFVGTDVDAEASASASGSTFTCAAPRSATTQEVQVSLLIDSITYAPPAPFTYFDCQYRSPGSIRNCSDCVTRPGCGWCGASCAPTKDCPVALDTCPIITAINPAVADAETEDFIAITTDPVPTSDFSYECLFGSSTRTPATVTTTGLRCNTPILAFAGALDVQIAIRNNFLGFWSNNVAPAKVDFYRCSASARQCGPQCFSGSAQCGFCLQNGRCSSKLACDRAVAAATDSVLTTSNSWFDSTSGCPSISAFGPTYMQAAIADHPVIQETVKISLANVQLPDINVTAKRALAPLSDFACVFGSDKVAVDSYDPAEKSFTCTAPVLSDQGFYSVSVTYKDNRINGEGSSRLQVQDCYNIPVCGLCLLQPNCGWCRGSVRCMTKAWCDAEPISDFGPQCPGLTRVSPGSTLSTTPVTVTITGGPFVQSPDLIARIEYTSANTSYPIQTTWVNPSTLTADVPASVNDFAGEVKLTLFMGNVSYTGTDLGFLYISPASLVQGVTPAAIGGIIAAAVAVILILLIALLVMRQRKVGFFAQFQLKEPDYSLIAFTSMLVPQWKPPKDNWDILAIKLLAKDHSFVLSLIYTTPPTDQDKIARSLCHLYEWHKKSVEYGVIFVTDEVKNNLEENTIFRNNSMASKWFKFYSKIIGIKYLFNNLARFIYELNKISEIKNSGPADDTGGKSLLSLEMEVDPNKFGESAFTDSEANVYQLILACQKVFTAFRTSITQIPREFKEIFSSMRESIINKFRSEDAVLKAVGGFFYLRFSCPAITAPHAYGLLEKPPNEIAQRQLVLIGKVIQNLANMTMPGVKEEFMQQLNDFFTKNIPKMRQFYEELLSTPYENAEETHIVETPDVVRINGLGYIMDHIHLQHAKIRQYFEKQADGDPETVKHLNDTLNEILESYPKRPRTEASKDGKEGK